MGVGITDTIGVSNLRTILIYNSALILGAGVSVRTTTHRKCVHNPEGYSHRCHREQLALSPSAAV
jgi:hypothetical protein